MSTKTGVAPTGIDQSMVPSRARSRRPLMLAAVIAVTALSLAACSSKPSGTPAGSGNSGSTTSSSSPASSGTSATAKLTALSRSVQSASKGSFKLSYSESSSGTGGAHTLTFEQMPPKYLFALSGTNPVTVVNTGKGVYTCTSQGGKPICVSVGTTSEFAPLLGILTGATIVKSFNSLRSGLAAKLAGVSATFSSGNFAGQSAECVSGVKAGDSFKYCVTDSGVLAYAGGSSDQGFGAVTLSGYSTSVSASDFNVPAGAQIVRG